MAKHTSRDDLESVATVYPDSGALGFLKQAVLPTAQPKANQARTQVAVEDEQPKSTKPAEDLSGKDNKPASKEDLQIWMLINMMAAKDKTDENGNLSASHISGFIKSLEALGVPTQPIKDIIEEVSGKPYADFEASASSGGYVSADAIVNHPRSGGRFSRDRGPLIGNANFDSARVLRVAGSDDAGVGKCARGVANVAENLGWRVERGHATGWDEKLSRSRDWVRLRVDPAHAPVGSLLVFDSDVELGKNARNRGGGVYGHVELVTQARDGHKVFVSDKARDNWGGSVPDNYAGAFLYVGPNAPAGNLQLAAQINGGGSRLAQSGPAPSIG